MTNNTSTTGNLNYSFIAVPTQLFILLDYRLKLVLTSMIQVSTALANSNGWFYYSKDDLKKICGLKSDKTIIASIETLFRLNIIQVQSKTFKSNIGCRTANYYRVNFKEIEKYNELSVYECLNINELQIPMLDYTSSDYKTTYTATTEDSAINEEKQPTSVSNEADEVVPSKEVENAPTASETTSTDTVEDERLTDEEMNEIMDDVLFQDVECPMLDEELERAYRPNKKIHNDLFDDVVTESPADFLPKEKVIETAAVAPTDLPKIERRSFRTEELDDSVRQKCEDLARRYIEMVIPNPNESADKCNSACQFITRQYIKGKIDIETKDRLIRDIVNSRFVKHSF